MSLSSLWEDLFLSLKVTRLPTWRCLILTGSYVRTRAAQRATMCILRKSGAGRGKEPWIWGERLGVMPSLNSYQLWALAYPNLAESVSSPVG